MKVFRFDWPGGLPAEKGDSLNMVMRLKRSSRTPLYWGWIAVWGAFLVLSINYGARYSFGIFVKPMHAEYNWPMSVISLGASINLVMYAVGGILCGRLLDRMAPRWIMTAGALMSSAGFIMMPHIETPMQLYIFYGVFCGLGSSGLGVVVTSSYIGKWFVEKRGLATGIATMGIGFGTMILTPVAGYLIKSGNWRNGFILFGILVMLIGTVLSQTLMRRTNPEAYGLLPDGKTEKYVLSSRSFRLDEVSFVDSRAVFTDRRFWIIVLAFSAAVMVEMSVYVHQVPYAMNAHIDKIVAASILGVIGVASIFGRLFFGWFSDRIADVKYAAAAGFLIMLAGVSILSRHVSHISLYSFGVIYGFGYGSLAPMMPVLISDRFGRSNLGFAYGFLTFFVVGAGGSLGAFLSGLIFDMFHSYSYAWFFDMFLLSVSALLVLIVGKGEIKHI